MQGIYIHIPFCVRKCGYCDFYSEAGSEARIPRFLAALEREVAMRSAEFAPLKPTTVFIGGGTPTSLTTSQLRHLGEILGRYVDLSSVVEWSCEINPGTLDDGKAQALAEMGVNRASLGVQSFDPRWLAVLDREHEAGRVDEALQAIRAAGIDKISLDLIFSLPGQTLEDWRTDLAGALARTPQHLSLYNLTFEGGTPMDKRRRRGDIRPNNPDLEAELYEVAVRCAREAGFVRYEVSNFARPGFESRHNTLYWRCADWLGLGPAAHSAHGNRRWGNVRDHRAYSEMLESDRLPTDFAEENDAGKIADEMLMMGLRMESGVDGTDFQQRTGVTIEDYCGDALDDLEANGLVTRDGEGMGLTDAGFPVLDSVVLELTSCRSRGRQRRQANRD